MSKEILYVVDAVSNEKNVNKEVIFEAVEIALATATRKKNNPQMDVRVAINRSTGDYETFRRWAVIDDEDENFESTERQILYSYAKNEGYEDLEVGDFIEEPIDSIEFGRIAAQTAKQVIVQKVRQAERERIVEGFRDRVGQLVLGTVKRVDRRGIILDMGDNAEATIPREEMLPRSNARVGDRMRGYLKEIREDNRGPQIIVSRTSENFLIELLKLEVPEIGQELIDIMGAARDPGSRAKIAVRSNVPNLDPVGACVGMRGSRVQSVTNELNGERIDIIQWDVNDAQFVINAMAPAEVTSIMVDEDKHTMDLAVEDEQLSQAIGKNGQNIRLASELTGWELNVMSQTEMAEKNDSESKVQVSLFVDALDIDEEMAEVLAEEGFSTLEEVAYVPAAEMMEVEGFDEEIVSELKQRAKDALLTHAIAEEEKLALAEPAEDLVNLEGMTLDMAKTLAGNGIITQEDLAELSIDELLEFVKMDEATAGELILKARAPWFEE